MSRAGGYWPFLLPGLLLVFGFTLFPTVYGVAVGFTNLNLGFTGWRFVGLDNYGRLLGSPEFARVVLNTLVFVAGVVVLQLGFGCASAVLLNRRAPGRTAMRAVAILPWVVPAVVSALLFSRLFGSSRLGLVNYLLSQIGVGRVSWFADPMLAMAILILVAAWRGVPFTSSILLGGLQTLPNDVFEAARIDGATGWQQFRHITVPLMRPLLAINAIMATAAALNGIDIPLALTGGGPGNATETLSISLYRQSFIALEVGYGAAIGTVMLAINLVLIAAYLRLLEARGQHRA